VLCPLLWVTLLGQGVGLGDPQRALPTPTMLGFWDSVSGTSGGRCLVCEPDVPSDGERPPRRAAARGARQEQRSAGTVRSWQDSADLGSLAAEESRST